MFKARKDLRARGYKFPTFAWAFSRPPLYAAVFATGTALVVGGVYTGFSSVEQIKAPYTPASNFLNVSAESTPALTWAKSFMEKAPPGVKGWKVSATTAPDQPVTYDECSSFGLVQQTLLHSLSAVAENSTQVSLQVYGAGQSLAAFKDYQTKFSSCWKTSVSSENGSDVEVINYNGGAFFSVGDTILFIKTPSATLRDSLVAYYVPLINSSLSAGGCKSLQVSGDDANRNLFFNPKSYTGLVLTDTVKTKVNLENIPTPSYQRNSSVSVMDKPEGPLDPSIPSMPKKTVDAPDQPRIDTNNPPFTGEVKYVDQDINGPGCGWAWTAQKEPVVNVTELSKDKQDAYAATYKKLDADAQEWVGSKLGQSRSAISTMAQTNEWNRYVIAVDKVQEKWRWLNAQRDAIQTPWYNYVEAHNAWSSFDARKASATNTYNADVAQCRSDRAALAQWEAQWGAIDAQQRAGVQVVPQSYSFDGQQSATSGSIQANNVAYAVPAEPTVPSPSPTPTKTSSPSPTSPPPPSPSPSSPSPTQTPDPVPTVQVPPRPAGCSSDPVRPAIMSQVKGSEPKPPKMAEGVTIPDSWAKPN